MSIVGTVLSGLFREVNSVSIVGTELSGLNTRLIANTPAHIPPPPHTHKQIRVTLDKWNTVDKMYTDFKERKVIGRLSCTSLQY